MMGGVHTDIDGATPLPGLYAAGEMRLRQHQRRQPARLQLADRAARVRRPRRPRAPPRSPRSAATLEPARARGPGERRAAPARRRPAAHDRERPRDASPASAASCNATMEDGCRHLPRRRQPRQGDLRQAARSSRSAAATSPSTTAATRFNTELIAGARARRHARRGRGDRRTAPCAARSRAARTSAPTSPSATTSSSCAHSLVLPRARRRAARVDYLPVHDHPLAARASGSTGGERWPRRHDHAARSSATGPRQDDASRAFQSYEVPLREDWVVLDALNYIKDEVDGTLSYRWSCRMGVCGSCGMMVNGEPKLTCADVPDGLRAGPGPRRAARELPGRSATWWSTSTTSWRS